jgi:heme-degrading monooxygenase HmoA
MILELAILNVRHGESRQFEEAFAEAKSVISSARGFDHLELRRCVEEPDRYALLVGWDHLEDHTEGFRKSEAYQLWRSLLHHFYEPFPVVEHYEPFVEVGRPNPE